MTHFLSARVWLPIAVALAAGGLGLGGFWLGQNHPNGAAQAQAQASAPSAAAAPGSLDPKAVKVSPRPGGTVTAITTEPSGFTFRLESGEDKTVRVVDGTIFQAGRDRPYSFGLLKVGDFVRVQGPGLGPKAAGQGGPNGAAAKPNGANAKPGGAATRPNGTGVGAFASDGTAIARRVIVLPAGERGGPGARKMGAGQGGAGQASSDQSSQAARPPAGTQKGKGGAGNGAQQ